jgi:hypothetical protein
MEPTMKRVYDIREIPIGASFRCPVIVWELLLDDDEGEKFIFRRDGEDEFSVNQDIGWDGDADTELKRFLHSVSEAALRPKAKPNTTTSLIQDASFFDIL